MKEIAAFINSFFNRGLEKAGKKPVFKNSYKKFQYR